MQSASASNANNEFLRDLPRRERDLVLQHCEQVTFKRDEILAEPGQRIRHLYFPIDSFTLLLSAVGHEDALGVGFVGNEGLLGASLVLGVRSSPLRALVQGPGVALRMKVSDYDRILGDSPNLERKLRLYLYDLAVQLAQTAVCAAFHVVELRLAYWLLVAHDRAQGNHFFLTQEVLGRVLGVRRSGVTIAAGVLRRRKLISYARGHIDVLDRNGLERAACSCYRAVSNPSKKLVYSRESQRTAEIYHHQNSHPALGEIECARLHPV